MFAQEAGGDENHMNYHHASFVLTPKTELHLVVARLSIQSWSTKIKHVWGKNCIRTDSETLHQALELWRV